jgi:hypothetical protein
MFSAFQIDYYTLGVCAAETSVLSVPSLMTATAEQDFTSGVYRFVQR